MLKRIESKEQVKDKQDYFINEAKKIQLIRGFLWIRYDVFDNENLNSSDILVYATLMRYMNNETKGCFPSLSIFVKQSRLSENTICKSLKVLEKEKLIHVTREKGKVNQYFVLEPTTAKSEGVTTANEGHPLPQIKGTNNTNTNNTNKTIVDLSNYEEPIKVLNDLTGRNFNYKNVTNLGRIKARVKDGSSVEEIVEVIKFICKQRMGTKFEMYLRPSTIFKRNKYEEYKEEYKYLESNGKRMDGVLRDLN